ncbi:hypothetical protein [Rhizobium herbae]
MLKKTVGNNSPLLAQMSRGAAEIYSLAMLVKIRGKRILLTGDAQGKDLAEAWDELGLSDEDAAVDILKVPRLLGFGTKPFNTWVGEWSIELRVRLPPIGQRTLANLNSIKTVLWIYRNNAERLINVIW